MKKKLWISNLIGASLLSAFTPLALSSCSKNNNENKVINHVTQSSDDIKYGLNAKTYSDIKNNYTVKFQDQMISKGIKKDSETWNNEMSQLNTALNAFDEISQNNPMSYTDLTNGVIDYARKTHGLTLRRTTTANFNDIEEEFQGAVEAFKDYAQHQHLSTSQIKQIIDSATTAYKQKLTNLERDGYKQNDPYGALLKVRADLFDFFNAGNAVIAKFAGYTKLANYQNQYVFSYKKNTNSAFIENILAKKLTIGQDMTNVFDEIFEIYDNERGAKVDHFDPAAVPGYTITPVYQGIEINKDSNQSQIKFSLEILSNNYKNTNDDARIMATAKKLAVPKDEQHFYAEIKKLTKIEFAKAKEKGISLSLISNDLFDLFDKVNETHGAFYGAAAEKDNLIDTYFNSQNENHISFVFPAVNERTRYESFFTGKRSSDVHNLLIRDLADAGLQISDGKTVVYLADVIKSVEAKTEVEGFNPATLPFVEKFVYYCNIEGVSTIKDKTTHHVSTNISVNYRNSQNAKESRHVIENLECVGYVPSIEDFMKMSLDYNKTFRVYDMYANPDGTFSKYKTWDTVLEVYSSIMAVVSPNFLVYWTGRLVKDLTLKGNAVLAEIASIPIDESTELVWTYRKSIARNYFKYVFLSMVLVAASGILVWESQRFSNQTNRIYSGMSEIFKEDYIKQLKSFMDEGKEVFVEMKGDKFKVDRAELEQKFNKFKNNPDKYQHYCDLVDQYKKVFDKDGDFERITKKYNVSLKEIHDFFDSRTISGNPVHCITTIVAFITSLALTAYLSYLTFVKKFKPPVLDFETSALVEEWQATKVAQAEWAAGVAKAAETELEYEAKGGIVESVFLLVPK